MTDTLERLSTALADRYQIQSELGSGGMATVYLAEDLKHKRKVAVKVLRPELAAVIGAERFLKEIEVTANLQHPNILALYDSGEADTFLYYVMPFVEGESLRERLNRETQLSVDETIRVTQAVAAALDYAHRHDVIHRDIKPENILLHDGQALVADFGIALAVSHAGGTRLTETGLSIGTPHYMSPEQAMGDRELDGRSDVYSLACVVYEMLAGEPPHTGPSAQAIVAKILTETPRPVTDARPSTPEPLAAAIETALEKLPADRFPTADAFATALTSPTVTTSRKRVAQRPSTKQWVTGVIAAVVAIVAFLGGRLTGPEPSDTESRLARFTIPTPEGNVLGNNVYGFIAISRDGERLAYVVETGGDDALFVRHLSSLTAAVVTGTREAGSPVFSPDGLRLVYQITSGVVRKVRLDGGSAEDVAAAGTWDMSWHTDGSILFGSGSGHVGNSAFTRGALVGEDGVTRIPPDGGQPEVMTTIDTVAGETGHSFPQMLPDGKRLLASIERNVYFGGIAVGVIDLETDERTILVSGASRARYVPSGHLVWAQDDGRLRASRLDLDRLQLTGPTVTIADGLSGAAGGAFAQFDVSDAGDVVYVPAQPRELVMVDRTGRAEPVVDQQRRFHSPRVSPNGRQIVMDIADETGRDLWVADVADGTLQKITFTGNVNDPIWTPDGQHVTYGAAGGDKRGIYRVPADGSASPDSIYMTADADRTPGGWFPDGARLVAIAVTQRGWQLETVTDTGERTSEPLPNTRPQHAWPAVSPDGRWLAYQSDETGTAEVYVRPIDGSRRVLVSREGGTSPVWHPSGRELFYRHPKGTADVLVSARVEPGPPFRVTSRTELFSMSDYEPGSPHANYDVHPDGDHFVMVRIRGGTRIVYVQNWTQLFEER
jgi:serine/threonine-protein kinase